MTRDCSEYQMFVIDREREREKKILFFLTV